MDMINYRGVPKIIAKAIDKNDSCYLKRFFSTKLGKHFIDNLTVNGYTFLTEAILNGHIDCIKVLVEMGCDVNKKDKWGKTSMIYAFEASDFEIIKSIVLTGATVEEECFDKMTNVSCLPENKEELEFFRDLYKSVKV